MNTPSRFWRISRPSAETWSIERYGDVKGFSQTAHVS
jgi:hypothetical protein